MENLVYLLPALACPIGMGLMMWMMMRRNAHQEINATYRRPLNTPGGLKSAQLDPDYRLAQLRGQLGEIQAQQEAIAAKIERLSGEDQPAQRPSVSPSRTARSVPPPGRRPG